MTRGYRLAKCPCQFICQWWARTLVPAWSTPFDQHLSRQQEDITESDLSPRLRHCRGRITRWMRCRRVHMSICAQDEVLCNTADLKKRQWTGSGLHCSGFWGTVGRTRGVIAEQPIDVNTMDGSAPVRRNGVSRKDFIMDQPTRLNTRLWTTSRHRVEHCLTILKQPKHQVATCRFNYSPREAEVLLTHYPLFTCDGSREDQDEEEALVRSANTQVLHKVHHWRNPRRGTMNGGSILETVVGNRSFRVKIESP